MEYPKQPLEYNGPFQEEREERKRRRKKLPAAVLACLLTVAVVLWGGGSGSGEPDEPDKPDKPNLPGNGVAVSELIPRIPDWYDPETDMTVHFDEDGYGWIFSGVYFARMYWRSDEADVTVDYACSYPEENKDRWGISSSQASDYPLYAYEEDGSYRLFFPCPFGKGNPYLRPLSEFPERNISDIDASVMYEVKDRTAPEVMIGAWGGMTMPEEDPCPFCVSFIVEEEDLIRVYESDTVACGPGGEYRESVYRFSYEAEEANWTRIVMGQIDEFYYELTARDGGKHTFRRQGDAHAWILLGEGSIVLAFEDFAEVMPLHKYA